MGQAPCLRFLSRVDNVSDLAGEKLAERFVADVLDRVFREAGVSPRFALLAPEPGCAPPRYHLYLEAALDAYTADAAANLTTALDWELSRNFHHAECRALGQLAERVVPVRDGATSHMEACRARGQRAGDVKPAVLDRRAGWGERCLAAVGPAL